MARGAKYHPKEKNFVIKCEDNGLYVNNPDDLNEWFLFTAFKGMAKRFTMYEAKTVKGHLIIKWKMKFNIERW